MDPNQRLALALPPPHPGTVTSGSLEGKPKKLTLTVDLVEGTRQPPAPVAAGNAGTPTVAGGAGVIFRRYGTKLIARVPRSDCSNAGTKETRSPGNPGNACPKQTRLESTTAGRWVALDRRAVSARIPDRPGTSTAIIVHPSLPMSRIPTLVLSTLFCLVSMIRAGEAVSPGSTHRAAILAAVNARFIQADPCGAGGTGPSSYRIDHLAMEEEWACIDGTARYEGSAGPFAIEFIALLKWNCGCWEVSSISFNAADVTRQKLLGLRRVPPAILPRWIRWSP